MKKWIMTHKKYCILPIAIIISILFIGRLPDQFTIPFTGLSWDNPFGDIPTTTTSTSTSTTIERFFVHEGISIESFALREEIYELGEIATVDFNVRNRLAVPYYIHVDWIHNDIRYFGWENKSTEIYSISDEYNAWYSYRKLHLKGEWTVDVNIEWEYKNKNYTIDDTITFKVI